MTLTIPNTISNGTAGDASEIEANFAAIESYVNGSTVNPDGSTAMTGVLTLDNVDPTLADHATRKSYVDGLASPSAWTAVTFQNSWTDLGGVDQTAQYRKIGDVVHLRGMITSGVMSSSAFTLPVGFRPAAQVWYGTVSANAFAAFYVTIAGLVVPSAGSAASFSLGSFQFSTV